MSSSVPPKRVRKNPEARRAEIVAAAAAIALAEGLECITMRRVAEELDVRPGLISHYFPVAEELVAEAFGTAATGELAELLPASETGLPAVERLARFLGRTAGPRYDELSRLWLNARHLRRFRPALHERLGRQEAAWRDSLTALLRDGVQSGEFRTPDPQVTAMQVLVVLDGLGVHSGPDRAGRPAAVLGMAHATAERELGLPAGTLGTPPEPTP
ncbi:TetR family transcriptional regulator C-terminal domain-containing protein [Kitasatospora sp. NPDC049285]|uniref:TetR/AcrR family transcriptional regulator n=1 Tax=Kitasatospora sp. NPDC049285 TaxID=3157096 RepID=UPI0034216FDF